MLLKFTTPDHYYAWLQTTPGEEAHFNPYYSALSESFCLTHGIEHYDRFMKVRIVKESGRYNIDGAWWKEKEWQDRTFWVYQTPIKIFHNDSTKAYLCYALEPFECERIRLYEIDNRGKSRWAPRDSLIVPTDCCVQCWDETQGGVSEHVRDRAALEDVKSPIDQPEHLTTAEKLVNLKTTKDREEEAASAERVEQIKKSIVDIEADVRWDKSVNGSAV